MTRQRNDLIVIAKLSFSSNVTQSQNQLHLLPRFQQLTCNDLGSSLARCVVCLTHCNWSLVINYSAFGFTTLQQAINSGQDLRKSWDQKAKTVLIITVINPDYRFTQPNKNILRYLFKEPIWTRAFAVDCDSDF